MGNCQCTDDNASQCRSRNAQSTPEQRGDAEWHYVLLGEDVFYDWRDKGTSLKDTLDFAKLRPVDERVQAKFAF